MGFGSEALRQAWRGLRADRPFTAVALVTLVVGIGVTTAAYSVVDAVLLRPLPFREPDQLVRAFTTHRNQEASRGSFSVPDLADLEEQAEEITSFGGYVRWNFNVATAASADSGPGRVWGSLVTAGLLPTLGVEPQLGRLFTAAEDQPGAARVVLIGHDLWQSRFDGDPAVVGRILRLDHADHEILGVLPSGFQYPSDAQLWVPHAGARIEGLRGMRALRAVGRLRPGATLASAERELAAIAARMENDYPRTNKELGFALVPLDQHLAGKGAATLWWLLAASGLVWLIACGNVASLVLERHQRRRSAFSIRRALGATRAQLFGLLFAEALLLALGAGLLSLAPAALLVRGVVGILRTQQSLSFLAEGVHSLARLDSVGIDLRVVAFALLTSVAAAVLVGAVSVIRLSEPRLQTILSDSANSTLGRSRGAPVERLVVAGQVAVAVCLLVVAALLGRSFRVLTAESPGFEPAGVITMQISAPLETYRSGPQASELFGRLLEGVEALPEVEAAGLTFGLPMSDLAGTLPFTLASGPAPEGEPQQAVVQPVAGRYFEALRLPVVAGRAFEAQDARAAPAVAMVNQAWAARFSPGQSPLGQRVTFEGVFGPVGQVPKASRLIVGVVGDTQALGLGKGGRPEIYVPLEQVTWRHLSLAVRARREPTTLTPQVQGILSGLDPGLGVGHVRTLEQVVAQSVAQPRVNLVLSVLLSGVSILLALVGLYGLVASGVMARQREFGLRMACGAEPRTVIRLVLGENLRLLGLAVAVGLGLAVLVARALGAWLYGVEPTDALTLAVAALAFLAVAAAASVIPARHIARIDPARALQPLPSSGPAVVKRGHR